MKGNKATVSVGTRAALEAMGTDAADCRKTYAKAWEALQDAERKAWLALAGYKFWMFGYHAAQWVLLKSLMPHHIRNPFKAVVLLAKQVVKDRGYKETENG